MTPRQVAIENGDIYYYTGKPCKHGHISKRFTSTRVCLECHRNYGKDHYKKHRRKRIECTQRCQKNDYENYLKRQREFYQKHKDRYREYGKREKYKEYRSNWKKDNRDKVCYYTAKYRALKKNATPPWVDWDEIEYIYSLAKEKDQVVDHMVPLTSNEVCGLHVGDNLRVIPSKLNSKKGNHYWPDMWETD